MKKIAAVVQRTVITVVVVLSSTILAVGQTAGVSVATPQPQNHERQSPVALKSNLLYDLGTAINLEFEIPVGNSVSVAAGWINPWWIDNNRNYCFQARAANIDLKYWLGNRIHRPRLSGWFVGGYAQTGDFDIEWGSEGIQGKKNLSVGILGGYSHRIGRSFSLEYHIGIGYYKGKLDYYVPIEGNNILAWDRSVIKTWVGPTRGGVSLVWCPKFGKRR